MSLLNRPSECRFLRHTANIRINSILKALRNAEKVTETDKIIVQAILEIVEDIQSYGPFTITTKAKSRGDTISLYYDQRLVLVAYRLADEIRISYMRDGDLSWAEELCCLANAHTALLM